MDADATTNDSLNAGFRVVNLGNGRLEILEGGVRKASYMVGESTAETIMARVQYLSDERAEDLVRSYGELATRHAARFIRYRGRRSAS